MAKNTNLVSQDELKALQDVISSISLQDVQLGRVLDLMASYIARLNAVDYPITPPVEVASEPAAIQEGESH